LRSALGAALGNGRWWNASHEAGIGKTTLRRGLRADLAGDVQFVALVELFNRARKRWPWL
jgi:hypothetical protein